MKKAIIILPLIFISSFNSICFASSYTWNGSVSNSWNNSFNWTPNTSTPGTSDTVSISNVGISPKLTSNVTVSNLALTTGVILDLGTYTLTVSGAASIVNCTISTSAGTLNLTGTSNTFTNSIIGVDVTVNSIHFVTNGTTFNKSLTVNKTGGVINSCGGNTFNSTVSVTNSSTVASNNCALRFGETNPDVFNGTSTFNNTTSNALICIAYDATGLNSLGSTGTIFNGDIVLTCGLRGIFNTTGGINFGIAGGTSTLNSGFLIKEGAATFIGGTLEIRNFTQLGSSTPQTLSLQYDTCCSMNGIVFKLGPGVVFNSDVNFQGSNIFLNGGIYNGATTILEKVTNGSTINASEGGNVFNSTTTYINNSTSSTLRLAQTDGDKFNGVVHFNRSFGTIDVGYSGTNEFKNDIYIDCGIITNLSTTVEFGNGGGICILNGTGTQTIYRPIPAKIGVPKMKNIVINKPSGNVVLNTSINILDNGSISDDLVLTSGKMQTSSTNLLIINNSATCNLGCSISYVDGPMNYIHASSVAASLNLPVGKGTSYRPAVLNVLHSNVTSVTYTAELFNSSANSLGYTLPPTLTHVSKVRYWQIDREAVANLTNAWVTLFYNLDDSVTDPSNLSVVKTNGTGTSWFDIGGTATAAGAGSITSTNFTTFSKFTLGNKVGGTNPLPITLLKFDATPLNNKVKLSWETASEQNNSFFTVERTRDGKKFEKVAVVDGAGNSNAKNEYEAMDDSPLMGTSYYRLSQTDFDGTVTSYNLKAVTIEKDNNNSTIFNVFPNPSEGEFKVALSKGLEERMAISVIDTNGKEVYSKKLSLSKNEVAIDFNLKDRLNSGIYFLSLEGANDVWRSKIVIE